MTAFDTAAESLEMELESYYAARGESTDEPARRVTVATNSALVERRAAPLAEMLRRFGGVEELRDRRVLDLGCGFGALAVWFGVAGAHVTGIDPNAGRMAVGAAVARAHSLDVAFRKGRMEQLPLPDGSFDVAVLNNSLCYLVDIPLRSRALREVCRVLRPGGVAVLRNPNRWHPFDQFTGLPALHLLPPRMATALAKHLGRERSTCRVLSPPAARRELHAAGFTGVRQAGFVGPQPKPQALKLVARYQHFVACCPASPYRVEGAWGVP